MSTYLPFLTSAISLITALAVAYIGIRNSRSTEALKIRASYVNYALQKLMDEYIKYDPQVDINNTEIDRYFHAVEHKFRECRESILRIRPLLEPSESLRVLDNIDNRHSSIIRTQVNAKLANRPLEPVDAQHELEQLVEYINGGHKLLRRKIESLRAELEAGLHKS